MTSKPTCGFEGIAQALHYLLCGKSVEALLALVDHNYPPLDRRGSKESLVNHVPGTITRFLPAGVSCMHLQTTTDLPLWEDGFLDHT